MSHRFQVDPFDLLGQGEIYPVAVHLPGEGQPKLTIAWNSFHQNFFSELAAFSQWTRVPKGDPESNVFRDCRIQRRMPYRALLAAALWHVALFIFPWPQLPAAPKRNPAFDNTELTWSRALEDLPLLNVPRQTHRSPSRQAAANDPPAGGTKDGYHPRQRIFTDPARPTHPRQTLVNTGEPMEAPKFLPPLPNIVQLAASSGPARPRLEISEQALARLRPKAVKNVATTDATAPDVPNMELHPADISLAAVTGGPARPKLEINAGSAPHVADRSRKGEVDREPEIAAGIAGAAGVSAATIIALSANPAPPAPVVEVPKGNLAARVALSPEGKETGTGGGPGSPASASGGAGPNAGDAAGRSSIGISISGGSPKANVGVSGLSPMGKLSLLKAQSLYKRPDPSMAAEDPPERIGPPNFAILPPGAKPEQIFASQRVYSMNVNMPNLTSVTGSWTIHFSELHLPGATRTSGEVSAPGALRKIDPKYPQDLMKDHVEGEVILYGVIRQDGTVDSIQLVRGIDKQLDANAIGAFSQWKFHPATKNGQPVALEAIVHIPFRGPERQ